ncbi:hypothetical protein K4K49_011808 [Colletotrichum sp. SAR 10_70]|nr:hypothetical protein K4K50_000609 [Colletotrichum sp. SAR 10_71]KAI8202149.1 hypothetical protein K4K49_011808 [Colletotrichum sp. SAR 10_70]KAI8215130.1 hypothetical protein K4K52_010864 [Colletotrichum sp. SAR 10_76]KAI8260407.1 hypothetical protein K4K53_002051 [Colletotrichum sp. SAR 10_77]
MDGSPVDEQYQMDLDTEYNTSFDESGTEVSPLESFFDTEIYELNSRQLRTREEFELSKAKNTEHRPFTVRDTHVSPTMAKKMHCGTTNLTDQTVNAVMTEDSDLVEALVDVLMGHNAAAEAYMLRLRLAIFELCAPCSTVVQTSTRLTIEGSGQYTRQHLEDILKSYDFFCNTAQL